MCKSNPKGSLDQRQCSGLLTFRAVGPQNVKPMLIFPLQPKKERIGKKVVERDPTRGSNKRTNDERTTYDPRVVVVFDPTMLASVGVMKAWAQHFRESTGTTTEKLVSMDNYYSHLDQDF